MNAENNQIIPVQQSISESGQAYFNRVHGKNYPAIPSYPLMVFGGASFGEDEIGITKPPATTAAPRRKSES